MKSFGSETKFEKNNVWECVNDWLNHFRNFRDKLQETESGRHLIIVQYTESDKTTGVVACSQHICREVKRDRKYPNVFVVFLVQLNSSQKTSTSSVGYHSTWECIHIDDIRHSGSYYSLISMCQGKLSSLFQPEQAKSSGVMRIIKHSIQVAMRRLNERKRMDLEKVSAKIKLLQETFGYDIGMLYNPAGKSAYRYLRRSEFLLNRHSICDAK